MIYTLKLFFPVFYFSSDYLNHFVSKFAKDCKLLQTDIGSVYCTVNYMKCNIFRTSIISLAHETRSIHFAHFVGYMLIAQTWWCYVSISSSCRPLSTCAEAVGTCSFHHM